MKQPVEDGGGDNGVPEHGAPLADGAVLCDHHGAFLIAPTDELEEQVGRIRLERQITELIDNEELRLGKARQALFQPPIAMGFGKRSHESRGRDELNGVASEDGLRPQSCSPMRGGRVASKC